MSYRETPRISRSYFQRNQIKVSGWDLHSALQASVPLIHQKAICKLKISLKLEDRWWLISKLSETQWSRALVYNKCPWDRRIITSFISQHLNRGIKSQVRLDQASRRKVSEFNCSQYRQEICQFNTRLRIQINQQSSRIASKCETPPSLMSLNH